MRRVYRFAGLCGLLMFTQVAVGDSLESVRADREAMQAASQQAEVRCYDQFAVHACLSEVLSQRRAQNHVFKKRELALHDRERQERSREQIQRLEDRARAAATSAPRPNPDAAQVKSPSRPTSPQAVPRAVPPQRTKQAISAEQAAENRAAFEEKQRAAAEHRANVARRVQDKKNPVTPLPVKP